MKVTQGEITSSITVPLCAIAAFNMAMQLLLVAGERAAHERCAQLDGQRAGVDRRQIVDHAGLQLRAHIGGRGELALGQSVHAVVFDDVDHRQIAAHEVHELPDADGGRVAVAADAEQRSSCWLASTAPVATDGMRPCTELKLCERLMKYAGLFDEQPMPRHLHHALGLHAHLVHGVDDALGDGVVAAAGAERGLAAAIVEHCKPDAIGLWGRSAAVAVCVAIYLPSW